MHSKPRSAIAWLVGGILLASVVSLVTPIPDDNSATTLPSILPVNRTHLGEHNACCVDDNVIDFETWNCLVGNHSLKCAKFSLDPSADPSDLFVVHKHGLVLGNAEFENGQFCHTNKPISENSTRTQTVAMVCHDQEEADRNELVITIKGCLVMISVLFVLATLYVYYLIPDLSKTQDKVTCWALCCLLIFMSLLGTMQLFNQWLHPNCMTLGGLAYFFTIAYFAWLNVIMWNVWKTSIFPRWKIAERIWYILNHVYAWTIAVVLAVLLFANQDTAMAEESCWLEHNATPYYLQIPMATFLSMNVVLLVWSAWGIHRTGADVSPDQKRALSYKFWLYMKLLTLAGVTWIFELMSFYYSQSVSISFWLIPDVINALHGVGIFIVLVLGRRRIRRELAGKRILCFPAPASWANEEGDSEESGLHPNGTDKEPYDLMNK